jgi:hypothetical protein
MERLCLEKEEARLRREELERLRKEEVDFQDECAYAEKKKVCSGKRRPAEKKETDYKKRQNDRKKQDENRNVCNGKQSSCVFVVRRKNVRTAKNVCVSKN